MGYVSPLRLFFIRAQVRAYLLAVGEFQSINEAFAPIMRQAAESGLLDSVGSNALQAIVERAMAHSNIEIVNE